MDHMLWYRLEKTPRYNILLPFVHIYAFVHPPMQVMMPLMCDQADALVQTLKREVGYGRPTYIETWHYDSALMYFQDHHVQPEGDALRRQNC